MNKIKVTLLNQSNNLSDEYLSNLTKLTYSEKLNGNEDISTQLLNTEKANTSIIDNVVKFNHTSILEHANYTFLIEGASRSFLAQITRHRLFSFTSGSQHYIDYSRIGDYVIPIEIMDDEVALKEYKAAIEDSMNSYKRLIDSGVDHSVARQVLPNAMRNNLLVTGNLRQFCNFLNLRLCGRNTSEIHYVAYLMYKELLKLNPTIMNQVGPDCVQRGHCTQGHKACGIKCDLNELEKRFKKLEEQA